MAMSSWGVIRHEYEDPHVQSYFLWQAFQTAQPVDAIGSGILAYSIVAGRQAQRRRRIGRRRRDVGSRRSASERGYGVDRERAGVARR